MSRFTTLLTGACLTLFPMVAHAASLDVSLRGSRASMLRQNGIARAESFSFLRTPAQVRRFVDDGRLLTVSGNDDYSVLAGYPYARPIVRTFIERLSADYHAACGEPLVVTSLTRPVTRQPRNASPLSVHPAGMAVDLRVSQRARCRSWLADALLTLEERGVLDATREHSPPHFHIAVFPEPYAAYENEILADSLAREDLRIAAAVAAAAERALQTHAAPPVQTTHTRWTFLHILWLSVSALPVSLLA